MLITIDEANRELLSRKRSRTRSPRNSVVVSSARGFETIHSSEE